MIVPVEPPLHNTLVLATVAVIAVGSVIVVVADVVHPAASVIVTILAPAGKLVAVAVVCTGVVFQEYE